MNHTLKQARDRGQKRRHTLLSKPNWETFTQALVGIHMYRIVHPRRGSGLFAIYEQRREPMDSYSSTLVDNWYHVGKAKTVVAARRLAATHEAARWVESAG